MIYNRQLQHAEGEKEVLTGIFEDMSTRRYIEASWGSMWWV